MDTKEAAAIARRKSAEDARKQRIFNPKERQFGVSNSHSFPLIFFPFYLPESHIPISMFSIFVFFGDTQLSCFMLIKLREQNSLFTRLPVTAANMNSGIINNLRYLARQLLFLLHL